MSMPTPRRANVSRISCRASQQWLRFICRQQLDHCEALDLVMSARAMSTFNLVVTIYTTSSAPFPEAQEIHGVWNSWWALGHELKSGWQNCPACWQSLWECYTPQPWQLPAVPFSILPTQTSSRQSVLFAS